MSFSSLLQIKFLNIDFRYYLMALAAFVGTFFATKIFQILILRYFKKLAQKTKTDIDDLFIEVFESIRPPFYFFLSLWVGLNVIPNINLLQKIATVVMWTWIVYQIVRSFEVVINYLVKKKSQENESAARAFKTLGNLSKWLLWALGGLFVLSNLGVNVTSLMAGLGIGGIAIAFALQNILADLFSSFAIYFDKPFQVGDFIVVGNYKGTVEKIGIKTTRLKSLQGEETVISNRELTSSKIQNFGKIKERRVAIKFGVVYETPVDKLRQIPKIVEEIVKNIDGVRFDRVYFTELGDFALVFELVYFVLNPDYVFHLQRQQQIFLEIKKSFEKEGIEFAYPTQTIFVKNST